MVKVVVLDPISPEGLKLLESAGMIEYEVRTGLKGEDLRKTLAEFDGAICRSGVKITADALEGNRRLKVIVRAGVGTDNIDTAAATRQGIIVMNTPGGNTIATAEHTMALMLALSRNIFPAYKSLLEGRWERHQFMGTELCGKTLGIIGLGRVGQAVAERALAFKMKVLGYDPFLPEHRARELGIRTCRTLDDLFPEVDYLTVHTPLNDQTRNLIDRPQIQMMKKGGAHHQLCARGHHQRRRITRGAGEWSHRWCGPRRLHEGAVHQQPSFWKAQCLVHAAPRRQHRGSPDKCGHRSVRAAR
ncbi:MAG: hypothetical protein KatS3mg112_1855 [Thermogutta sp.]|nr:MAG: hypothetical protein KatS3mg112_1855 [Thermogutta sp.]